MTFYQREINNIISFLNSISFLKKTKKREFYKNFGY